MPSLFGKKRVIFTAFCPAADQKTSQIEPPISKILGYQTLLFLSYFSYFPHYLTKNADMYGVFSPPVVKQNV